MLTIHALDRGAEEREELVTWLNSLLHEDIPEIEYVPRIDIRPVSLEELKYSGTPDICIVGHSLLEDELTTLGSIRKQLPTTPIIACTSERLESLAQIEQLARLGATDTLSRNDTAATLLRKLVLLAKYRGEKRGGKLIVVDSGKGGVGVTSLAASLAEVAALQEKRVALVDFDFETQDLSRFLQSRPFINENLQLLLEGNRTLSEEFVDQCIQKVWEDDDYFYHVSPPPESDALYSTDTKMLRTLLSFFEVLDEKFECVIIDAGSCRGAMQKTLYRAADHVVFVLNNDPATLYSSVDRVKKIQAILSPTAGFTLVDNNAQSGLSRKVLIGEFTKASKVEPSCWLKRPIPHCRSGAKWPASGGTFVSLTKQAGVDAVEELAGKVGILPEEDAAHAPMAELLQNLTERAKKVAKIGLRAGARTAPQRSKQKVLQTEQALPERKALPIPSELDLSSKESSEQEHTPESSSSKSQAHLLDLVKGEKAIPNEEQNVPQKEDGFVTPSGVPLHEHASGEIDLESLISKATIQ